MATEPQRPSPVFLVAAPRTGAATLRHMLAHHRDIAFAPMFDFLVDGISPDGRFMKRDAFLRSLEFNMAYKRLGLTIPPGLPFAAIAQNLIEQVAATKPAPLIVGATVQRHFDRLLWLWPDARFIHLVRDGRDVAYAHVLAGKAGNMWHGIADWVEAEMLWDRMSHKLPPDRQFTLKYESLVGEPQYELHRICQFLGVPFDPAMIASGPPPPARRRRRGRRAPDG
ncbi:MAG: sulfotransferase [Sphingomonadales bacterium]|nr:MAG: sulfotransferase [Sphingomonadales bacterium]